MHLFFIEMLATSISRFFDVDQRLPRSCLKLAGPRSRRARWSSPPFDRCENRGSVVRLSFRFNARGARTRSSRFDSSLPPPGHTPRSRRAPAPPPGLLNLSLLLSGGKKKKHFRLQRGSSGKQNASNIRLETSCPLTVPRLPAAEDARVLFLFN